MKVEDGVPRLPKLPDKLFFKIGEVSEIVGVAPHVLRYWESEFRGFSPMKTRGAHRVYRRRDVEFALAIRQLIHDEGYTIAGARRKLKGQDVPAQESKSESSSAALRADLVALRAELASALRLLDEDESHETEDAHTVTITAVVPGGGPATAPFATSPDTGTRRRP